MGGRTLQQPSHRIANADRFDESDQVARFSRPNWKQARGQLAPFMRDALVGLNYAYYEPPALSFCTTIRCLSARMTSQEIQSPAWSESGRLRSYLARAQRRAVVLTLSARWPNLPYVLSEMEQDFIAPENVQALIWRELVPGLFDQCNPAALVEREPQ